MKRNNKALYEKIMRNVAREVKRTLNENVSNDIDILSIASSDTFNEFFINSRFSGPENNEEDKEIAIYRMNEVIKALFKTKRNFINFVKGCTKRNWDYVCDTDYERLDDEGWNIWINDAIEDERGEWGNRIDYDALESGEYDVVEGDEEPLFDRGEGGLIYHMVENNDLNVRLKKHPEENYYEKNGF